MAGATEHDGGAGVFDQVGRQGQLLRPISLDEAVADVGQVGLGLADLMAHRLVLVAVDEHLDVVVERRRVQLGLAALGGHVEQLAHGGQKAHVGHAVGLVDHHLVDVAQADAALFDQVGQAAGACDEDVDAPLKRRALRVHTDAAVHGEHIAPGGSGQGLELAANLLGQLAGGRKDQGTGAAAGATADLGHQRKAEGKRFAGAGWGTGEDVTSGERIGNCSDLNIKGSGDAGALEHGGELVGHAKRAERGSGGVHCGGLSCCAQTPRWARAKFPNLTRIGTLSVPVSPMTPCWARRQESQAISDAFDLYLA